MSATDGVENGAEERQRGMEMDARDAAPLYLG